MFKKTSLLLLGAVAVFSLTGCATILKEKSVDVTINSEPSGADVFIKNNRVGRTPLTVNLAHKRPVAISFKMNGYEDVTRTINNHMVGGWIVSDLFLAGPWTLVDLISRNAASLNENVLSVKLDPKLVDSSNNQNK